MEDLTWDCAACGTLIADGDGFVQARESEIWDLEETTAWIVDEAPDPVPWVALHGICDGTDAEEHIIPIGDLRTWPDIVRWTTEMLDTDWLGSTDWVSMISAKRDRPRA